MALLVSGCGDAAPGGDAGVLPTSPTWFGEVQAIVSANCGSCHGATPYAPNIAGFRLDRYVKGDTSRFDAYDYQVLIGQRAVERSEPAMPPTGAISSLQQETLRRWIAQGGPKGQRSNSVPQVERFEPTAASATANQNLLLSFRSFDEDGDGLIVDVAQRNLDGSEERILFANLATGKVDVEVDTGQLVSGSHVQLFARLDDGYSDDPSENLHEVVLVDDLLVEHGNQGTAPSVTVLTPNGGGTVIGATTITWQATDPDPGDQLSIAIDLLELDASGSTVATTALATGLANDGVTGFAWDTVNLESVDSVGNPIDYKIRVVATDAGALNTRDDVSDSSFSVAAAGGSDLTWDDVKPLFLNYCSECHSEPAKTAALDDFRLDKYDAGDLQAPANTDVGVFETKSLVYDRLVIRMNMPPAAKAQPSQAERSLIGEWILAGAPLGSGSGDAPPSFLWVVPNNTATTQSASASLTLEWNSSDPEMQPLTGSIEMAQLPGGPPPPVTATARCDGSEAGYVEVVSSANIEDGSFVLNLPGSGFFCFRGSVTDAAGQSIRVVASRPVEF